MELTSFSFVLFFVIICVLYWLIPYQGRILLLAIASLAFYALHDLKACAYIMTTIMTTFFAALCMERCTKKKPLLILVLCINVGLLLFVKYTSFGFSILEQLGIDMSNAFAITKIIVPLGISFYTFQALGYLFDVYNSKITAEKNLWVYIVYISFFVKIMQGPIEKSENFLAQLKEKREFSEEQYVRAFVLILVGLFKKLVIADRFAIIVNNVYSDLSSYSGANYLLVAVLYSFQIYCDFAGYTDIVRGYAGFLGFDLIENFDHPYLRTTIKDFWRSWHKSLTQWFTKYIYIPLGGSKKGRLIWMRNVFIVFAISGLWHGAAWNFVLWGILHALFQIIGSVTESYRKRIWGYFKISWDGTFHKIVSVCSTFAIVTFAWIFFRAPTIEVALQIVSGILSCSWGEVDWLMGVTVNEMILSVILLIGLIIYEVIDDRTNVIDVIVKQKIAIRWLIYFLLIFSVILFGIYGDLTSASFIYVQF